MDCIVVDHGGGYVDVDSGVGSKWHYHQEIELTLITGGNGTRYVGDDVSYFEGPELVLLGKNLPHHWSVKKSSGFCIQFKFEPFSPLSILPESHEVKELLKKASKGLIFSKKCTKEVLEMVEECSSSEPLERLSFFIKILHRLVKARPVSISSCIPQGVSASKSAAVKKAVHFIIDNASDEKLTLSDVLQHVKVSRATFSRHFQNALGQNFTHFLQSIRLETARNLLTSTDKSITEIAYESGFSNLSHFNFLFKKRWDKTPRELRAVTKK